MIIGTFITNTKNSQTVSRFNNPLYIDKLEYILLEFINTNKKHEGTLQKPLYKYIYMFNNESYYVLVTSLMYDELKGNKILNYLISNTTADPIDQLVTIDNTIVGGNVIFPNMSLIKKMESQEEKIYKLMMKNKEAEVKKKQDQIFKSSKEKNKEVSPIMKVDVDRNNMMNMKVVKTEVKEKKKRFETSKSKVFVCLKEKLSCSVDIENNIKNVEVLGEMNINIKDEAYKSLVITLDGELTDCKFSPKLDKDFTKKGIIKSSKDFSLNKNIALMKWKKTNIKGLPISFTFWPSEIKLNTYQVSLEFTAEEDLDNLTINIPKSEISEVIVEDAKQTDSCIEWEIGTTRKGECDTLDFQCKCDDIKKIFPIEIYFTSHMNYSSIEVINVLQDNSEVDECEIKKIIETESFKLCYE